MYLWYGVIPTGSYNFSAKSEHKDKAFLIEMVDYGAHGAVNKVTP